jgi:membrane-associated phospholipid phosphatase
MSGVASSWVVRQFSRYMAAARVDGLAPDVINRSWKLSIAALLILLVQPLANALAGYPTHYEIVLTLCLTVLASTGIAQLCFRRYRDPVLGHVAAGFTQLILGSLGILALSYVGARLNMPLIDDHLAAIDRALGLDWLAYARFLMANPDRLLFVSYVYSALDKEVMVVGLIAVFTLRFREYQVFLVAFLMAALFASAVSALLPAYGTFYHYGLLDQMRQDLQVSAGYGHVPQLIHIRLGLPFDPSKEMRGIITFPSFHAAGGLMLGWLFWQMPYLRWVLVPLNVAMIAVTPLLGAHYFSDVLAGLLIATVALLIARKIVGLNRPSRQTAVQTPSAY